MSEVALFDPAEHEPLCGDPWNEDAAREFVARVVEDTDRAFDPSQFWPLHPEDRYGEEPAGLRGVYSGAAGTMWALHRLATDNDLNVRNDYADAIAKCEEAYRSNPWETGQVVPAYFLGTTGIRAARYALTNERGLLAQIDAEIRANADNPSREAFWGAPGSAVAGLLIRERDGERCFDDALRAVQDALWKTWIPPDAQAGLLWEQDLHGRKFHYVGAGHGAFGNLAPFVRASDLLSKARKEELHDRILALLERYALREGDAVNWISHVQPEMGNRIQWCHGAPGVIISLAAYPTSDERLEDYLRKAGEAIWLAGPVKKGPTICHGTAGNGYALLRLAHRTGNLAWRERALRFAVHAMRQVSAWREEFGMPSFSLWTGELGVALFVSSVLRGDPNIPGLDVL